MSKSNPIKQVDWRFCALFWGLIGIVPSCASVQARAPLPDNRELQVVGYGAKAAAEVKCLRPRAIEELTGSQIPPEAKPRSCYWTVILASNSSAISKAVSSYVLAERELVQNSVPNAGRSLASVEEESSVVNDVVNSLVIDIIVDRGRVTPAYLENTMSPLSPDQKASASKQLRKRAAALKERGIDVSPFAPLLKEGEG